MEVLKNISTYKNETASMGNEDLILSHLGPRRHDLPVVVILLIIYCLIFISGTVGNICTCVVIVKNNYMQTTTNYYLFSLAISDMLTLLFGLPPEAYAVLESYPWRFGEAFCLFKSCLFEMTAYVSVLTITAFSVERYIAICYPLKAHKFADLKRSIKIIIAIWIVSFFFALPYPIHTRTFYVLNDNNGVSIPETLQCNIPTIWRDRMRIVFQISTILFFVFPMSVITVLYVLIALALRKTTLKRSCSEESRGYSSSHSIKAVLRMLVAVVVAFFVCWAPFHAQRLLTLFITDWNSTVMQTMQRYLFYISGVLFFVSSTVNPILYNVMSVRYRQAFRETLCCCFIEQPTSRRNTMEYTYIKSRNRSRSNELPSYFKNSVIRKSYEIDDSQLGIQLLQNQSNLPIQNGRENGSNCPTCKYGSSKEINGKNHDQHTVKQLYLTDSAMKFSRIGTHV
ncbi:pyrokinin-1 receptor-like [Mytilus galloprovincialis]|uniref:pyrokinin-1 receptor-like n=1 Tax=Mytilus galloprovincialis TaxID=29158 RepID=UPI003F7C3B20